jgi:hypothetical protein
VSLLPLRCLVLLAALAAAASAGEPLRLVGVAVEDAPTRRVVERPTVARRLPPVRYLGTRLTTEWLLERPPLAATLARHLHPPLERYHLRATGEGLYQVDDQGALRGQLRLVAAAPARRVYYCQGEFRSLGHLLALTGGMVFALEYRQVAEGSEPRMEVVPQLFVRLDNLVAHGLVTVLGPLLTGVIDRRAASLAAATTVVTERITRDPAGLYREMAAWPDITPQDLDAYRAAFLGAEERP